MARYIRLFKQEGVAEVVAEDELSVSYRFPHGRIRTLNRYDEGVEWEYAGADPAPFPAPDADVFAPPMDPFHVNPETDAGISNPVDEEGNPAFEEDGSNDEPEDPDSVVESEQPEE